MIVNALYRLVPGIMILSCAVLCQCRNVTPSHTTSEAIPASEMAEPEARLSIPFDTLDAVYGGVKRKKMVAEYYRDREGAPIWHSTPLSLQRGDSLVAFVQDIRYYGLSPGRYHGQSLSNLRGQEAHEAQQQYELLLTDAYLLLYQELQKGISAKHDAIQDSISLNALDHTTEHGNIIGSLIAQQPDYPSYHALIDALRDVIDAEATETEDSLRKSKTIQTIEVNLERWRREMIPYETRYAFVNIPSCMIHVVDKTDTILSSRVIVGKPDRRTPELTSVIECFTLYPYWHVPRRISVEEYLPVIQRDTSFITKNNFDVLDRKGKILDPAKIPWASYNKNNFPVTLRQREGTENALGLIKFTFDNPYEVFLHDTNAKRLFRNNYRALSHGCIRMEKAEAFAHYLLAGTIHDKSPFIRNYLNNKIRIVVNVPEPMPIYIRYFTAEIIGNKLQLYPDIYKNDNTILQQLTKSN